MTNLPLVTIIIPVFNGSNYLREAIDSAINQSYKNIEIIVINDGSDDSNQTKQISISYGYKIRYIEKDNGGVASALNLGIRNMNGEYFSWLSHDDIFEYDKIEKEISFALQKNALFVFSNYNFVTSHNQIINKSSNIDLLNFNNNLVFLLMTGYPINGSASLIHKDVYKKVGEFNEMMRTTQDYDFWFRTVEHFKPQLLNKKLMRSRQHENQDSSKYSLIHNVECNELYSKYIIHYCNKQYFTNYQILIIAKSLLKRKYFSSAMLINEFQKKKLYIIQLYIYLIFISFKSILRTIIKYN